MRRLFILTAAICAVIGTAFPALADPTAGGNYYVDEKGCSYAPQQVTWILDTGDAGVEGESYSTAVTTAAEGTVISGQAGADLAENAAGTGHTEISTTDQIPVRKKTTTIEPGKPVSTGKGRYGYVTKEGDPIYSDGESVTKGMTVPEVGNGGPGGTENPWADDPGSSMVTYHSDGKIEVTYGDGGKLTLFNTECDNDDCLAEQGARIAEIINEAAKEVEHGEIRGEHEGEWTDNGYWTLNNGWIPPSGEFIPAVISTSWSVSWQDVDTTFDLDLHQNATSSGSGSDGTEDSMTWKETTGTATVKYKKVHDYTEYIWTIIGPDGEFVETHTVMAGETVRKELFDAGTWTAVVVPKHYYHIERTVSYEITGTRYKKVPVYREECGTCKDEETGTEYECDCGDVFDHYDITSESLGSYSNEETITVKDGIDMDDHNKEVHQTDVPMICIGCPGVQWCVGCEPGTCDNTDRYICDDNLNRDEIIPYAYLIE